MKFQILILTIISLICAAGLAAQSGGGYAITQSVIAGGGGQNSAGGAYAVDGSVAQTVAGQATGGGDYGINAGFWLPQLAPSMALVSVAGRVRTANGQGIRNIRLTLTDANGTIRTAQTGSFGYYRFDDVQAGQLYVMQIFSNRFMFANPTRVLDVQDNITNADWVANGP